jgi:hypothetical protein
MEDNRNCKLDSKSKATLGKCNDKGLATQCEAMLQGRDRLSRFENWRAYIEDFTRSAQPQDNLFCDVNVGSTMVAEASTIAGTCSKVFYVANCGHDFDCMLKSQEAQCLLFDQC